MNSIALFLKKRRPWMGINPEELSSSLDSFLKFFYIALLFVSVLPSRNFFFSDGAGDVAEAAFDPVWPVFWTSGLSLEISSLIVRLFFFLAALLAALFYRKRFWRILAFIGVLQFHAFESSFISFIPQWYIWLYATFILMFVPTWSKDGKVNTEKASALVWFAQIFVLSAYTISGVTKLILYIHQSVVSGEGLFSVKAGSLLIADWLLRVEYVSELGPYLIERPTLSYLLIAFSIYVQVFALWAAFKAELHRLWGALLIVFHFGTFLSLGIIWIPAIAALAVLLLGSPFEGEYKFGRSFRNMPLLSLVFARKGDS